MRVEGVNLDKIRFGVVGLGFVAEAHSAGLLSNPQAVVEAICDVHPGRLRTRGEEWGVVKRYSSFDAMLRDESIDAVDVLTPPFLHAEMAVAAAEARKHVLVEKPMCTTLREADRMISAARKSGVKLMVAESYVFLTPHVETRKLIESGVIGEPLQVREVKGVWLPKPVSLTLPAADLPWREHPVRSGGGDYPWAMDHFPHFFATARYFMKDRTIEKAYSMTATHTHRREGDQQQPVKDISIVSWEYTGGEKHGLLARADDFLCAFDHLGFRTEVNGTQGSIQVLGEGGGPAVSGATAPPIVVHEGRKTIAMRFDEGPDRIWLSEVNYYDQAHRNEIEHFVTCLLEDRKPRYTGEDGRKEIQATLATIMSAMEDKPVRLASVPTDWSASAKAV